jgi:hydroxylamine reductase (hybrid-cluster protein)
VTGGILNVDKDPVQAVEAMLNHIEGKRKKLGI